MNTETLTPPRSETQAICLPEAQEGLSSTTTALVEHWDEFADEFPSAQDQASTNIFKSTKIYETVLVRGREVDSRDATVAKAVEEFWLTVGPTNHRPELALAFTRGALLVLRDGNETSPQDTYPLDGNTHSELFAYLRSPESLQSSSSQKFLAAEMTLDAAHCSEKPDEKQALFAASVHLLKNVLEDETFEDTRRAKLLLFDLRFNSLANQMRQAELDNDSQRQERLIDTFVQLQSMFSQQFHHELFGAGERSGVVNEIATIFEYRYTIWQQQAIGVSVPRTALRREDEPHDGLKRLGLRSSFDVAVEHFADSEQPPNYIQLKSYSGGGGGYNSRIDVLALDSIIPEEMRDEALGQNRLNDQHKLILRGMLLDMLSTRGASKEQPNQRTLAAVDHASRTLLEVLHKS